MLMFESKENIKIAGKTLLAEAKVVSLIDLNQERTAFSNKRGDFDKELIYINIEGDVAGHAFKTKLTWNERYQSYMLLYHEGGPHDAIMDNFDVLELYKKGKRTKKTELYKTIRSNAANSMIFIDVLAKQAVEDYLSNFSE